MHAASVARRCKYLRTSTRCNLNCGETDPACSGMDQHSRICIDSSQMTQAVNSGCKNDWQTGGFNQVDIARHTYYLPRRHINA